MSMRQASGSGTSTSAPPGSVVSPWVCAQYIRIPVDQKEKENLTHTG